MTSLVVRKASRGGVLKLKLRLVPVVHNKEIRGGGIVKLERVPVVCPACGQQVEAVAGDGRVKGYCAVAKQSVDFLIETWPETKKFWQDPEYRAKQSAAHIGKRQTAETRTKISATLKGRHNKKGIRVDKQKKGAGGFEPPTPLVIY